MASTNNVSITKEGIQTTVSTVEEDVVDSMEVVGIHGVGPQEMVELETGTIPVRMFSKTDIPRTRIGLTIG